MQASLIMHRNTDILQRTLMIPELQRKTVYKNRKLVYCWW